VNESLAVRAVERVGDLDADLEQLGERERPAGEPVGERFALEMLHDEVVHPVLVPHVEERADVRVVEARDDARLALEALARLGAHRQVPLEDLDGDGPVQARVPRPVDLAHSPGPE